MGIQRYLGANTLYGRKRSRLAGSHDPEKPEIKQYNMLSPTDRDGYSAVELWPWMSEHVTNFPSGALGAWKLHQLYTPAVGTGDSQRVGKSIYLRGIQIRGYIEVKDNLCFPCNWRLVLYRQKSTVGGGLPSYGDLYHNFEAMDLEVGNEYGTLSHYRHNFYKAMYNQEWNDVGTRQVLAKGRVVPCLQDPRSGSIQTHISLTYEGATYSVNVTDREIFGVSVAYQPIKKIIKCNIDHSTTEDYLYLMLETDFPVGCSKVNAWSGANVPNANVRSASLAAADVPFKFNIFVRGYFTDP